MDDQTKLEAEELRKVFYVVPMTVNCHISKG